MILRERLDSQPWDFTQCFTSILAHREAFRLRLGYLLIYQIRQALDHYLSVAPQLQPFAYGLSPGHLHNSPRGKSKDSNLSFFHRRKSQTLTGREYSRVSPALTCSRIGTIISLSTRWWIDTIRTARDSPGP